MAAGTKSATSTKPAAKTKARGNQGNAGTPTAATMPDGGNGNITTKPARKGGGRRGT